MQEQYLRALIFAGLSLAIALFAFLAPHFLNRKLPNKNKLESYECGEEDLTPDFRPRSGFAAKYCAIAILFVIFDVEIAMLLPCVSFAREMNNASLAVVFFFIISLAIGFVYELRKGTMKWK